MAYDRMDRLPQWAQAKIRRLEQKIADLEQSFDILRNEHKPTRFEVREMRVNSPIHYMPEGAQARFRFGKHQWIEARLDYPNDTRGKNCLRIMASQQVMIIPDVANSFRIIPEENIPDEFKPVEPAKSQLPRRKASPAMPQPTARRRRK